MRIYPPATSRFYPSCPVFNYLHLLCPGCGTTRALAELLRGHVGEALRLNALTMILLPCALGYAALCYGRALRPSASYSWPRIPPSALHAALAASVIFSVARNLL